MKLSMRFRFIVLFLLSAAVFGAAQVDTARMQGTITDKTGAALSGATVTLTNSATGRVTNAQADNAGYFAVAGLTPGPYHVEIKQQGFKTFTQDVTLQTGQIAPLNASLEPGQVNETLEVKGDIPLVESASSNISEVIVGRQVTELPLNGRNFTQLATLAPGVTRGSPDNQATGAGNQAETFRYGNAGGASLSVNGLRPQANNFLLDGIDNNESLVNSIIIFPNAEAIQEFRVDTSVAPAEYGRAGGGVVSTTYRSGTNSWHGSAFEFFRNDNLDAHPFFNKAENLTTGEKIPNPEFKRNQFGGSIGGPLIKNKLFIFGDYSGWRQTLPLGVDRATVPTQLMRQGNFSELTQPIFDPTTNQPFAGNIIPAGQINTVGQNYLNLFPLPNCSPAVDPNCGAITNNFKISRTQTQRFDDFDVRGDWNLRTNDSLFARYSYGEDIESTSTRLPPNLPAGFGSGDQENHPRSIAIGETHVFSPTLVNEFRAGWVRTRLGFTPPLFNQRVSAGIGIPGANPTPELGGGALIGGFNGQLEFTGDFGLYLVPENTFQYSDSLSWTRGKHTFKFGAAIIRRQVNLFRPRAGKGFFQLFGNGTQDNFRLTGYEVSDILAGFVNAYQIGPQTGTIGTRSWENGVFVQDDWKVTPRLTLNLGLRYDLLTWPDEVLNRQSNFDLATGRLVLASDDNRHFIPIDKNNFAPRVGFAYDLFGTQKSVLRGGYGLFYFVDRGGIDNQLGQNPPFGGIAEFDFRNGFRGTLSGTLPNGTQGPLDPTQPASSTNPIVCLTQCNAAAAAGALPTGFVGLDLNNPTNVSPVTWLTSNRNSYVQEWNTQIQQELSPNTALTVAYVGTKGTKLVSYFNANRPAYFTGDRLFPNLGSVTVMDTNGSSTYHSLQTQVEHRLSHGVQFTASYTWSHTIDDSTGAFENRDDRVDFRNLQLERGNSNQDVRHRFVFSSIAELPFGRGHLWGSNMPGIAEAVLGGWQVNPIITLSSGYPFDLLTNNNARPNVVGNPQVGQNFDPANGHVLWFNPAAFADPGANQPGNLGRNALYGPGTKNIDLSFLKNFHVTERVNTQFHADFFNLFNTPQFGQPVNGGIRCGSTSTNSSCAADSGSTFGQIGGTRLSTERQIQFALRVTF